MPRSLRPGAVDELRVRLVFSRVLEGPAHDVFMLDVRPPTASEPFDGTPILALLDPVLYAGSVADAYVVHLNRTHSGWAGGVSDAEIVVALSTGIATSMDPAATEVVRSALREVLLHVGAEQGSPLPHDEAMSEARMRVEKVFPDVRADALVLTDEEHVAAEGSWSVGLSLSTIARFGVAIGFVDGDPQTTHVRRTPGSEIVDSVGAE